MNQYEAGVRLRIITRRWWMLAGLVLLAAWLPAPAMAAGRVAKVLPNGTCTDGPQPGGAVYRICMPAVWNGDLVVYAHGYVSPTRPVGIPEDQVRLPNGAGIDQFATDLGYAFVMSSFRTNGLAVADAGADLQEAAAIFAAQQGNPRRVLLIGVSEGGLIAVKNAEAQSGAYDGALALCGPYGDFNRQTSHFGDFRVIFDYLCAGAGGDSALHRWRRADRLCLRRG